MTDSDDKINEQNEEDEKCAGTRSPSAQSISQLHFSLPLQKNAIEESPPSPISSINESKQSNVGETGLSVKGKGKFPCKIGDCTDVLPYSRMVNHIRYLHEEFLIDVSFHFD